MEQGLDFGRDDWQGIIDELHEEIDRLKPQLVALEAQLSDELVAISAFEFQMRAHLEPSTRRLDRLDDEIAELKTKLRHLQDSWMMAEAPEGDDLLLAWRMTADAGAAADDAYRYHAAPAGPPPAFVSDKHLASVKNLYRQLARRFHPDFALNEDDRTYRTGMMMAINAAYTAADLQKLEELAREPDPLQPSYTPQDLAQALLREVDRCRNRIAEITADLKRLSRHPSALLKKRADSAARRGRDLLEEIAAELRDRVAERMVQRDGLLAEIDAFENGDPEFVDDAFADAVFNLGLEQALMDDGDLSAAEWRDRHRDAIVWGDGDDEEGWEALRKARRNQGK